jgi:hypothetical protein
MNARKSTIQYPKADPIDSQRLSVRVADAAERNSTQVISTFEDVEPADQYQWCAPTAMAARGVYRAGFRSVTESERRMDRSRSIHLNRRLYA